MKKEKLYFAHPISTYGSEQELRIISMLSSKYDVINPSADMHQDKAKKLRGEFNNSSEASKAVMDYFVEVANGCDACAVLTFPKGELGAGTVKEAQSLLDEGKKVFKIKDQGVTVALDELKDLSKENCLDVENTKETLKKYKPSYNL